MKFFGFVIICVLFINGCNSCQNTKTSVPKDDTTTPDVESQIPQQETTPTELVNNDKNPPKKSCICKCTISSDQNAGDLCKHFVLEKKGDEKSVVCDTVFQIFVPFDRCEDYIDLPEEVLQCSGFHPKTKAGDQQGKISACVSG